MSNVSATAERRLLASFEGLRKVGCASLARAARRLRAAAPRARPRRAARRLLRAIATRRHHMTTSPMDLFAGQSLDAPLDRPERPGVFALCVLLAALLSIVLLRG